MKIRVADFIVKELVKYGIKHTFLVTGGGAMHLNDALGRNTNISYFCNHHEQACAIAAEGYARIAEKLAVVFVTTGPGGLNTLTGVMGQWTDSVPVLYISGQVKYETTVDSCKSLGLRQLGDQEIDIVSVVRPLTKFAVMVKNPLEIKRLLHEAIYKATHGRPGPVWIDVPMNIQSALVEEEALESFNQTITDGRFDTSILSRQIEDIANALLNAQRPVLLIGNGSRISGARQKILEFALRCRLPCVTSFLGCDLVPTDHPCYIGRVGTIGTRAGNFCVQNSDFLLALGTRNNIRQVSYNWKPFARAATRVYVDIDNAELEKSTVFPHYKVHADVTVFLEALEKKLPQKIPAAWGKWLDWSGERKKRYPAYLPEYAETRSRIHPYHFVNILNGLLLDDDVIVTGNATPSIVYFQAGEVRARMRTLWNSGCAAMGYDLSAAIGAAVASGPSRRVICLAGDGSLQMNIQELQTLFHHQLNVKLFVFDNEGYVSIIQTQDAFFGGHRIGCTPSSGVSFPDFSKVIRAFGLPVSIIDSHEGLHDKVAAVLDTAGPVACVLKLVTDYKFSPKNSSEKLPDGRMVSKPLEDMFPFLSREEFRQNMIIPEWVPEK